VKVTPEKKLASISTFAALPGVPAGGVCANAPLVNARAETIIATQSTGNALAMRRKRTNNDILVMAIPSFKVMYDGDGSDFGL
jgi:hypothetical protein